MTVKKLLDEAKSCSSSKATEVPRVTVKSGIDEVESYPSSIADLIQTDSEKNQGSKDTGGAFSLAGFLKEKCIFNDSEIESVDMSEGFNNKESAMKKTAPLIEVLQQTRSGSRRVNFSAWKGLEKDLTWESTLLSISPSSTNKKQEPISDDVGSTVSIPPEAEEISHTSGTSLLSTSPKVLEDASSIPDALLKIKLVATKRNSVLATFGTSKLLESLKAASPVFLDLHDKIDHINGKDSPIHVFLHFKTTDGMMEALDLKYVEIDHERLYLETRDSGSSSRGSIFEFWNPKALSTTISMSLCQTKVPLKSINNFFSVFGAVQVFGDKETAFIKFENSKAKTKALNIHQFAINQQCFKIRTDVSPDELVVRLLSKEAEADDTVAEKACSRYGSVAHILPVKAGVLDAHYEPSENENIGGILKGLENDRALNGSWIPSVRCQGYDLCSKDNDKFDIPQIDDFVMNDIKKLMSMSEQLSKHVLKIYSSVKSYHPMSGES